jgi:hypothetical protein
LVNAQIKHLCDVQKWLLLPSLSIGGALRAQTTQQKQG